MFKCWCSSKKPSFRRKHAKFLKTTQFSSNKSIIACGWSCLSCLVFALLFFWYFSSPQFPKDPQWSKDMTHMKITTLKNRTKTLAWYNKRVAIKSLIFRWLCTFFFIHGTERVGSWSWLVRLFSRWSWFWWMRKGPFLHICPLAPREIKVGILTKHETKKCKKKSRHHYYFAKNAVYNIMWKKIVRKITWILVKNYAIWMCGLSQINVKWGQILHLHVIKLLFLAWKLWKLISWRSTLTAPLHSFLWLD